MTRVVITKETYFIILTLITILFTIGIIIYTIIKNKKIVSVLITAFVTDVIPVIIIDARNADCLITAGEIDAISTMYLSIATIISWAEKVNKSN